MIDLAKLSEHDLASIKVFEGTPSFNLSVSKPEEMLFLIEGLLMRMGAVSPELMNDTMDVLASSISELGVEEGVKLFFDSGDGQGKPFPEFMRPMFVHVFTHMQNKRNNE